MNVQVLMFRNEISGMSNLKGNIGILIFSTIAKILDVFVNTYSSKFQCLSFTPANDDLIPVYEILSKEAEKQSDLVYANKETGKRNKKWYLMNKTLWQRFLSIKQQNQGASE